MTEQWGAPLTGAQMKLLRLNEGDRYQFFGPFTHTWGEYERGFDDGWDDFCNGDYRLPADHPAYTLLEAGWLDGRNVRLHYGSDRAPDDWDCGDVLVNDTHPRIVKGDVIDQHNWSGGNHRAKIIVYIAKVDAVEQPETVTIAKMTEEEAREWVNGNTFGLSYSDAVNCLSCLGLIKPEPTREERFWALHEPEGTTVPTHIKKWVKDALEFEQ